MNGDTHIYFNRPFC